MRKINKDTNIIWNEAYKKTYDSQVHEIISGNVVLHTIDGITKGETGDFIVKDINKNFFIITKENIKYNYENFRTDNINKNKDILDVIYKSDDFSVSHFIATRLKTKIKYVCVYEDFELETTNGTMYGKAFDYIIKTPKTGYLYRIEADTFSKTYNVDYTNMPNREFFKFKGLDVDYIINTLLVQDVDSYNKKELWHRAQVFMNSLINRYRFIIANQEYPIYEDRSFHEYEAEQDKIWNMIEELRNIILNYYVDVFYC